MSRSGLWLNAAICLLGVIGFVTMATVFGVKWLTKDELDRSHPCGSGSRGGICFEGETVNMVLTIVFAAIAVFLIVMCVSIVRSLLRR